MKKTSTIAIALESVGFLINNILELNKLKGMISGQERADILGLSLVSGLNVMIREAYEDCKVLELPPSILWVHDSKKNDGVNIPYMIAMEFIPIIASAVRALNKCKEWDGVHKREALTATLDAITGGIQAEVKRRLTQ